jgi:hypothetical protein
VSEYRLVESLPKDLQAGLPSIERIEQELSKLPAPKPSRPARKTAVKKQAQKREGRR